MMHKLMIENSCKITHLRTVWFSKYIIVNTLHKIIRNNNNNNNNNIKVTLKYKTKEQAITAHIQDF